MVHKFIQSNRGKKVLAIDGYLYRINYHNNENNKIYWKCKTNQCNTSVITKNHQINNSRGKHNYGSSGGNQILNKLFVQKFKKLIKTFLLLITTCLILFSIL